MWSLEPSSGHQLTLGVGTGIRQEHLAQVFKPFFTTKDDLGTGIGLWVAKQLVEARGGEISVVSSTKNGDSGTTLTIFIHLPLPLVSDGCRKGFDSAGQDAAKVSMSALAIFHSSRNQDCSPPARFPGLNIAPIDCGLI